MLLLAALRFFETILPSLAGGSSCWSSVTVQNLGDRAVVVDVNAHRESGALVSLRGQQSTTVRLEAGGQRIYRFQSEEETTGAWVLVRETIPSAELSAVVAVSGATECLSGEELRTVARAVVYPMRNPWFSSSIAEIRRNTVSVINASEFPASVSACYSFGTLISVPGEAPDTPVCSVLVEMQIPPFSTTVLPVERGGNSQFYLKTAGDKIALQMLRPLDGRVKMYSVDSTITFGYTLAGHEPP